MVHIISLSYNCLQVPPSSKSRQDSPASPHQKESPTPRQPSTPTAQPVVTPPSTPEPVQAQQSNEVDGTPVTTEPAEDERSQSPAEVLQDEAQDGVEEDPDLGRPQKNVVCVEYYVHHLYNLGTGYFEVIMIKGCTLCVQALQRNQLHQSQSQ